MNIGGIQPICVCGILSVQRFQTVVLFYFSFSWYYILTTHITHVDILRQISSIDPNIHTSGYFVCFELEIFLAFRIKLSSRKGICWSNLPLYKWEIKAVDIFIFKAIRFRRIIISTSQHIKKTSNVKFMYHTASHRIISYKNCSYFSLDYDISLKKGKILILFKFNLQSKNFIYVSVGSCD